MKRILPVICLLILMLTAVTASGTGETVPSTAAATEKTLPQVQNIRFVSGSTSTVTLSWDGVKEADRYYIYHYNEDEGKFQYIGQTTDTKADITELDSGSKYKFTIRAVSFATGKKQWGNAGKTVDAVTAPEGSVLLKTKTIDTSSISIYWDRLEGADGYKVFYYDRIKGEYLPYNHTGKTSMTVSGLEQNTYYSFKVRAYTWADNAIAYGEYSDVYLECTDTEGVPRTAAQCAKAYNTAVNNAKKQQSMNVKYTKSIDTQFLMCDVENLANTVKNTLNLYDGTMNRIYKFQNGASGKVTADSLFEPYGEKAFIERDDIEFFYIRKNADGYTVRLVLKSEESFFDSENQKDQTSSYYDSAISLPKYSTLDTTPLKIKKADSYYSAGSLSFIVKENRLSYLKIRCDVVSSIDFTVSTLSANSTIVYSLAEDYAVSY